MKMETRIVPFLRVGGLVEQDDVDACLRVLHAAALPGGSFVPRPQRKQFAQAFASHEGVRKAVAVNACGTALDLWMMALNIGPGDEVIVPPLIFVCISTCAANWIWWNADLGGLGDNDLGGPASAGFAH